MQLGAWVGVYVVMVAAPIGLVLVGQLPEGRGFWVEFGVGLGLVGLAMMGVQFALTARFRRIAGIVGMDSMLHFHRQAGIVATLFVLAHPVILVLADREFLAFFDPRVNLPRAGALTAVTVALLLVVALPLARGRIGLSYEWWRLTHGLLGLFIVLVGLAHVLMVSRYMAVGWKQALWVVFIGAAVALLVNSRLLVPWRAWRRPWKVASVRTEAPDVWTITLEAAGHSGLPFRAGQCIWLTLGPTPFSLQQHPFTIASSAVRADRLELTIKALGDFTSTIGNVAPGTPAFLEGPYGNFTVDLDTLHPAVFFAGGIGITPVLSILRTLRERGDRRPLLLVYANASEAQILLREEFEQLAGELELRVCHVLKQPPEGWSGEVGRITPELIERVLNDFPLANTRYYVCGADSMMDTVETELLRRGVGLHRIHSERFNIV